jgi:2-dehydro-3-deoxyphosphooctonate aldolase (KDO 8-P synthase)
METHPDPAKALSDGPNAWPLAQMESFLEVLKRIDQASKASELNETALLNNQV